MPYFPGGTEALADFVHTHFEFTQAMFQFADHIVVHVEFVVNETGEITDIEAVECSYPGLGAERKAVEVMQKMPPWVPGNNGKEPVKVRLRLPVNIQIN